MGLTRREFLVGGGAALGTLLAPGSLLAAVEANTAPLPSLSNWDEVRRQFSLSPDYLHFSGFFLVSHPRPVRDAIDDFRRAIDANPYLVVDRGMFLDEAENLQDRVRRDMAPYLGARPEDIALTGSTTESLSLVYHGLPLKPGDEVLLTTHDHIVHHQAAQYAAERSGASLRKITLFDEASTATVDGMLSRAREGIGPSTRVLGITWVHSATGMRLPIREFAAVVKEANRHRDEKDHVLLVVDGVHGIGAVDDTIAEMGADYVCAGTHKWMFAPRGTGLIWARSENWARLRPLIPSFSDLEVFEAWKAQRPPRGPTTAARMMPGGFHAYEHQWATGAAFRMHRQMGRERVAARIRELNSRIKDGLAAIPKVKLHTPRDPALSAGINCFEVAGLSPDEVVKRLLERRIVASSSPYAMSYARLSAGLMNTPEEVDRAVAAVRAIAG